MQILNNVSLACGTVGFVLVAFSLRRAAPSRAAEAGLGTGDASPAIGVLWIATTVTAALNWIFALIQIARNRPPLLDGWLLGEQVAGLLMAPVLITLIWLVASSLTGRPQRLLMLGLTFAAGLMLAAATGIEILTT